MTNDGFNRNLTITPPMLISGERERDGRGTSLSVGLCGSYILQSWNSSLLWLRMLPPVLHLLLEGRYPRGTGHQIVIRGEAR